MRETQIARLALRDGPQMPKSRLPEQIWQTTFWWEKEKYIETGGCPAVRKKFNHGPAPEETFALQCFGLTIC